MAATLQQKFNIPPCPGIDRAKPYVRAAFGKRFTPPVINAIGFSGPACSILTRQLATVVGGNQVEAHKNEYHETEHETVPAHTGT